MIGLPIGHKIRDWNGFWALFVLKQDTSHFESRNLGTGPKAMMGEAVV